ncbi:hypothetical protein TNCV_904721 [Trichonephila clavipes]|nr:hypothetical protein TNCV_904721 [Trichonephila clavipes]
MTKNHRGMQRRNRRIAVFAPMLQRSRENEQNHQNIYGIANTLLKGCTTTCIRNYDQKFLACPTVVLHEIPYVLQYPWHVSYPTGMSRFSSDEVFN